MSTPGASAWDGSAGQVSTAALAELRLTAGDVDTARLDRFAVAAIENIDSYLDGPVSVSDPAYGPRPETVFQVATNLTVEAYRRKDSPFGIANAWGQDGYAMRIPADVLAGSLTQLRPYKVRFGIG